MRIRSRDAEVPTSGACGAGPRADSLREDWENVTQRVSQVLLDYLDREHDAH